VYWVGGWSGTGKNLEATILLQSYDLLDNSYLRVARRQILT